MAIKSWADQMLAAIRPYYPEWYIWYVPSFPNGQTWHAKPVNWPVATINASSPEEIIRLIKLTEESDHA